MGERMATIVATVKELAAVIAGSEPVTIMAGAACSRLMPTDVPDAGAWKRLLLEPLVLRSSCGLPVNAIDRLTQAAGVQLEAIFAALGRNAPGLGEGLVQLIEPADAAGCPNALHRLLMARVLRVPGTVVFTTNFDQCFERAALAAGRSPRRWIAGHAVQPGADIFKLHGSTEDATTLRHTFESIGRAFPQEVRNALRPLCAQKIVALGYFGADPDVLELLGSGDTVWWLTLAGDTTNPRHGAGRLGRVREVHVATGNFDDLLTQLRCSAIPMGDGKRLTVPTAIHMRTALDPSRARSALAEITFRALTASVAARDLDDAVAQCLGELGGTLPASQVWRARGMRARYRGGQLGPPVRSACLFLRAAMVSSGPSRWGFVSDALDAAEMLGGGLIAPFRAAMLPFHGAVRRRLRRTGVQSGSILAIAHFRVGRSALFCGLPRMAAIALTNAFDVREGDMFLGGIALRWRAQARARLKDDRWREDIDAARELFAFEDRQQELADLLRSEASCVIIMTGDIARARELLQESRDSHQRRVERRGVFRCSVALRLLGLGAAGRCLLRFLLP